MNFDLFCIDCDLPVSEVMHGTPPVFSNHRYIQLRVLRSLRHLCDELGHIELRTVPGCARCGQAPIFVNTEGAE